MLVMTIFFLLWPGWVSSGLGSCGGGATLILHSTIKLVDQKRRSLKLLGTNIIKGAAFSGGSYLGLPETHRAWETRTRVGT